MAGGTSGGTDSAVPDLNRIWPVSYGPTRYPAGSRIQIAGRSTLEEFARNWKYHHKLEERQLDYADSLAIVEKSYMYHGGDILYELKGIPGIWHEQCLAAAPGSNLEL
jgi:hypothetical protein